MTAPLKASLDYQRRGFQSPGDQEAMSAKIHSLHLQHAWDGTSWNGERLINPVRAAHLGRGLLAAPPPEEERVLDDNAGEFLSIGWVGGRQPTGRINGREIAGAQDGILTAEDGTDLGTYERVVEFGGPNGDQHEIKAWPRCIGHLYPGSINTQPGSIGDERTTGMGAYTTDTDKLNASLDRLRARLVRAEMDRFFKQQHRGCCDVDEEPIGYLTAMDEKEER
jgi:hypothetical protein